ncbi:uncharacterized protein An07g10360 [Aspergillus niger]|uniref:Contig An07c0380, genomic contig n=2 Tax=Aspergillus niger TaxID=5061 RepID=A2QPR5_ASPNC|nr:uncharacterized protein An07g10360 [Aspergillus niger]CAK45165.1 unnamed protein product [Aspergillus niger]
MQGQGVAEEKASIQYQTAAGSWLNVEQLAGIDFREERKKKRGVDEKENLGIGDGVEAQMASWPGDNTESSGAWPESSVPPGPLLEPRLRPPSCSSAVTANY